jgi:IrrE N-terminal-like domain
MINIDYARRRARGGTGVIPPNNTQWDNEHHALDVREDLGVGVQDPLPSITSVYQKLLPTVAILPHGQVPAARRYLDHFRGPGQSNWSGLAMTMGDGSVLVIYNDAHPESRCRATLMEEFFHIYLEHPGATFRLLPSADSANRKYDGAIEREAYGCAAAALVPYGALSKMVAGGVTVPRIAAHFRASRQLVFFRLKVTKLYCKARRWSRS